MTKQTQPQLPQTLTTAQLAERWSMDPVTLRRWRARGKGPSWIKLGDAGNSLVRYPLEAIELYEREQTNVR